MKVNGMMILHHIQRYFNIGYASCSQDIHVKTPVFYNIFFDMNEHIVLVDSKDLRECASNVRHSVIICLDPVTDIPDHPDNDLIILDDALSQVMAFNILTYILDLFNEWEARMNEILYKNMNYQDMIEEISRILGTSVALTDANFYYIAYTVSSASYHQFVDGHNRLPLDKANALMDQADYKEIERRQKAFVYTAGEKAVFKNIFHNDTYVGRLSILLDDFSDADYYMAILDCAAVYIESLYDFSSNFDNPSYRMARMHNYLTDIYAQKPINREPFFQVLRENCCFLDDTWSIIYLVPYNERHSIYSASYLCSQIEYNWPGSFCIPEDGKIILLFNHSLYERNGETDFPSRLTSFINDLALIASISRPFSDITHPENISAARIQAEYALEKGTADAPEIRYHEFDQYALQYLLKHGISDFRPDQVCHPAVLTLYEYDLTHETSFAMTLYTYMKEKYNAVSASKALYIHRSSFINRMERIHKLVDINMDDIDECLYLMISFRLLYEKKS